MQCIKEHSWGSIGSVAGLSVLTLESLQLLFYCFNATGTSSSGKESLTVMASISPRPEAEGVILNERAKRRLQIKGK